MANVHQPGGFRPPPPMQSPPVAASGLDPFEDLVRQDLATLTMGGQGVYGGQAMYGGPPANMGNANASLL